MSYAFLIEGISHIYHDFSLRIPAGEQDPQNGSHPVAFDQSDSVAVYSHILQAPTVPRGDAPREIARLGDGQIIHRTDIPGNFILTL